MPRPAPDVVHAPWKKGPRLPRSLQLLNAILSGLQRIRPGFPDFSPASAFKSAERWSGYAEWEDKDRLQTPVRLLLEAFDNNSNLTPTSRVLARAMVVGMLSSRQRIRRFLKEHPEILDIPIRRPLFVVALPRTGTTLLYNLLAEDPAARPLLGWEAQRPVPPRPSRLRRTDPRIRQASRHLALLRRILPEMQALHPIQACGPEECVPLLSNTVTLPTAIPRSHAYHAWLREIDPAEVRAAYEEYKQQLQLLQWQRPGERWVLKSPMHLFGLDALLEVFPDACIVQTHRDPMKVLPSACSLTAAFLALANTRVDADEVGAYVIEHLTLLLSRSMAARASVAPGRILDIQYADLVRNPVATVRRIYEHFDYDYTPALEQQMKRYMLENPRYKHGRHQYYLRDFGLTEDVVEKHFGAYRKQFDVPAEASASSEREAA